jgi:hypothetical protein
MDEVLFVKPKNYVFRPRERRIGVAVSDLLGVTAQGVTVIESTEESQDLIESKI